MDENKSKLEREHYGKTYRLYVAISLLASIGGVELSPALGSGRHDEIALPLHTPHESKIGFNMFRLLVVSGVPGTISTSFINFN